MKAKKKRTDEAEDAVETDGRMDTLREQYGHAIDLYKHEDTLNWKKLATLFYVNVLLAALVGFALLNRVELGDYITSSLALMLISSTGIVASVAFGVAMISGWIFLHCRKKTAVDIERVLKKRGGVHLIVPDGAPWPVRRAPTSYVLAVAPFFFLVVWTVVLISLLLLQPAT